MLTKIESGIVCDASRGEQPTVADVFLEDAWVVSPPRPGSRIDLTVDARDCYVMAGAIDIHTHIGGGKANLARLLCRRMDRKHRDVSASDYSRSLTAPVPSTVEAGKRYLEMGYTSCFEPAILPANARQAHLEMGDTPWLDTGGFLMLGNEEFLLQLLSKNADQEVIRGYVSWMLFAHQCVAVKVVNAVGISAFKSNARESGLDDPHPKYGVTARQVLFALAQAVDQLQLPHPLHVHCNNLGRAGNIATTLGTIEAVQGHRIHLTHAQFHSYSDDGPNGYGSAAAELAAAVNLNPNVSIDVGQTLFQRTVTLSADVMHQFANRHHAHPTQLILQDTECQAGCGVLPFRYRNANYVNALQWSVGLQLFLKINDPSRVFLTTDHPNGAPFTSYPHLLRLLGDRDFRNECFETLNETVRESSELPALDREYSMIEIAKMTRSGPAAALGLSDRGSLSVGARADVVVYPKRSTLDHTFGEPSHVFRAGCLVYRDGVFVAETEKQTYRSAQVSTPELHRDFWTSSRQRQWSDIYGQSHTSSLISEDEFESFYGSTLHTVGVQ
jgi:formylmethanofuran dehydrogenase subunit A